MFLADDMPAHTDQWDPSAPPRLLLLPDPGGKNGNSLGSYCVFRKPEQSVRGFKANEKTVAAVLTPAANPELAGATLVGRFGGGTPVLLSKTDGNPGPNYQNNNFNYAAAGSELKCPCQPHIRKAMPRTDAVGVAFSKTKRLVRRGIPFEDKPRIRASEELSDNPADQPTGGVGLLFMCYVASIKDQVEFVPGSWVNAPGFSQPGTGKDPSIGQPAAGPAGTTCRWPVDWGQGPPKPAAFGDFVTMRGGEYFFAPSLSTLQRLRPAKAIVVQQPNVPASPGHVYPGNPVVRHQAVAPLTEAAAALHLPALGFPFPLHPLSLVRQLLVPDSANQGAGVVHAAPAPA